VAVESGATARGAAAGAQAPATQENPVVQARPQLPQLLASLSVLTQVLEQAVRPPVHTQVPVEPHTPPVGLVHVPEVRGAALHTVPVPVVAQTVVPVCWQPPVPADVQLAPVETQVPPQFDCPVGHASTQLEATQVTVPPIGATQARPQAPQLAGSVAVLTHAPPHAVSPPAQPQVPVESHTPPAGPVHAPEVRGAALHTVVVPVGAHTRVPVCWQPPVPAEVQAVPVALQVPPQFDCPAAQPHVPVESQTPPAGAVHAPEVRGVALHTVVVPVGAHTRVPVCAQPPVPAEVQAAPVAVQVPPQFDCPAGHGTTQAEATQLTVPPVGGTQAWPQDPQLALSVVVFTHAPLQFVYPALQATPQPVVVQVAVPLLGTGQGTREEPRPSALHTRCVVAFAQVAAFGGQVHVWQVAAPWQTVP
jgi:hypothetical protein